MKSFLNTEILFFLIQNLERRLKFVKSDETRRGFFLKKSINDNK